MSRRTSFAAFVEFHEAGVLDAIRLRFCDGKDHPLADVLVRIEDYLDIVPSGLISDCALWELKQDGLSDRRSHDHRRDASRSKRQGGNMPFPDRAKTQDEAPPAFRRTRLIRMGDNARIEQCRRFEGIFVQKIGSDQLALSLGENGMRSKASSISSARASKISSRLRWRPSKFSRTSASWLAAVSGQALGPVNDMVRPRLVDGLRSAARSPA